jgi:Zn ribbon nucleic-acid-binding protein
MNAENRQCQNCKKDFVIESDDFLFYEKIKVPAPTFCPECRMQRRLAWRNERGLFKRKCDAPGHTEMIVSIYPPKTDVVVYDHDYWHSDKWDPMDYGVEYDFDKTFFSQFKSLLSKVPVINLFDSKSVNSNYCNVTIEHKNCYLVSSGWGNEDCLYSNRISYCKDTCDSYCCHKTEFCYDNLYCKDSTKLFYSLNSESCVDSYFLYDCRSCVSCIGCTNLRNKSYCIFNQQYSKEEYQKFISENNLGDRDILLKIKLQFEDLYKSAIHRYAHLIKTENVIGDNIENSQNCYYCFDLAGDAQNVKYCHWGTYGLKDSYDTGPGTGGKSELTYEGVSIGVQNSMCSFGTIIWNCNNVLYSFWLQNCSNCFGCVGLKNKQYCVFNKQYSKEEYFLKIEEIKKHMEQNPYIDKKGRVYKYGEFFPIELSPFPYNATVGQDYMPVTENIAEENNYPWEKNSSNNYEITLSFDSIPNTINGVSDSIIQEIISCKNSNKEIDGCVKAFRVIKQEFDFYNRLNIPIPIYCPNCRHNNKLRLRNPLKLWHRKCMCSLENHEHEGSCQNEFETSYAPDRLEKVFCESCYQREVL